MRAVVAVGGGSVALHEVPEPECPPDGVVIAVDAFSVNRGETFLLESATPGWRPGKDVAGTVVEVGAHARDENGLHPGQRVVAHPDGRGWAERVAVVADKLALLPDDVSSTVAAALPLAGMTALRLLRTIGELPGRSILMTGASGGVGHYFVELAAGLGARVTALTSSASRGERLLQLGAAGVCTSIDDVSGPFDVVVESVGGPMFSATWRLLDAHGLFVWMGQASRQRPTIDFFDWTGGSSATLRKFLYSNSDVPDCEDLATLVRLVARDRLHPEIGRVEDWSATAELIDDLINRRIRGNAIVEVRR